MATEGFSLFMHLLQGLLDNPSLVTVESLKFLCVTDYVRSAVLLGILRLSREGFERTLSVMDIRVTVFSQQIEGNLMVIAP